LPKKVKKCYGQQDCYIVYPCHKCRYAKGCFAKSFDSVYTATVPSKAEKELLKQERQEGEENADT